MFFGALQLRMLNSQVEFHKNNTLESTTTDFLNSQLSRRRFLISSAWVGLSWALFPGRSLAEDSNDFLEELTKGNVRFASGKSNHPHTDMARVHDTGAHGQHPRAVVLSCADSRVSPEILFDQGVGDIFTVRVAGNVANNDEIASVEYAVEHLHVPLCIVLGHSHCGAVKAVVEGAHVSHAIESLVAHVGDSFHHVQKANPSLSGEALVSAVVEENIRESIRSLKHGSEVINESVLHGHLRIVGALYDIESAQVHWIA